MVSNKLNLFIHLNAYRDSNPSNNPSLSHAKWTRDMQGISAGKASSQDFCLAPGESKTVFNGSRSLTQDGTAVYSLTLKAGTTSTYLLKNTSGTAPIFRTARATSADATTQATVTKSGTVITIASTGGTAFSFIAGSVIAGDEVIIGDQFAQANRGKFKILNRTATSISFENNSGSAEGPITLGATFADQVRIYSANGVQKEDKLKISGGFSPSSQDTYEITDVQDNLIEFYSTKSLPQETGITTDSFVIYSSAKKFLYLEADQKTSITLNGTIEAPVEPFVETDGIKPGIMMRCATVWSLTVSNSGTSIASLYVASVE
jgi:hypothetical protein